MKIYLPLLAIGLLFTSACKKEQDDPILPEPTPTLFSFDGQIGAHANSTLVTKDDHLLICGNQGNNYNLLKVSKAGVLTWRKDYDNGSGTYRISGIAMDEKEDVFICGHATYNSIYERDVLLIKTNAAGDTIWTRTYGGVDEEQGYYIIATTDGNLLICGASYTQEGAQDIYLLKVNTDGDTLWTRKFATPEEESASHVMETRDGKYLITGSTADPGAQRSLYYLFVNEDGSFYRKTVTNAAASIVGFASDELSNGDIITCGRYSLVDSTHILLVRTDNHANIIWIKVVGEWYRDMRGHAIAVDADGSCIITGITDNVFTGQRTIVIAKTDQHGELIALKEFGQHPINSGQNIIIDSNGDYLFTGTHDERIFLTRTDSDLVFK